jgi:hypothetical protein
MSKIEPEPVIIHVRNGGLGDHLQYSTLPRRFAEQGRRVLIHPHSQSRSLQISELVWGHNPFVSGVAAEGTNPNAGSCARVDLGDNSRDYIAKVEVANGLEGASVYPEIYYAPATRSDCANAAIVDFTACDTAYRWGPNAPQRLEQLVRLAKEKAESGHQVKVLRYPHLGYSDLPIDEAVLNQQLPDWSYLDIDSIHDLCSVLFSCRALFCLHSGVACLAPALKRDAASPEIHVLIDTCPDRGQAFIFPNCVYHPVEGSPIYMCTQD